MSSWGTGKATHIRDETAYKIFSHVVRVSIVGEEGNNESGCLYADYLARGALFVSVLPQRAVDPGACKRRLNSTSI